MKAKAAPLSLDISYPTLIHLVSEVEGSCDAGYDVEYDVQVAQSKTEDRRWRVELGVRFSAKGVKRPAFTGEIRYVGIFTVSEAHPTDKISRLVAVNAPSILYSSIRELVALLSGRSPLRPSVLLPSVSFIEGMIRPSPKPETHSERGPSLKEISDIERRERRKTTPPGRRKTQTHIER